MQKRLLVADDDAVFRDVVSRVFEGADWKTEGAEDGISALEKLAGALPDALLLDLHMPGLGGRELLGRMKKNPRLAMIPVIILSGDGAPEEQAREFGLGADDFVVKPFNSQELLARVEGAVRRARRLLSANPLTRLPGGPAIEEDASRRIAAGGNFSFFHIDIDNFKAYNDAYGYLAGDDVLKRTAELLSGLCAMVDDCFLGHIGGDDFAVMCPCAAADDLARRIALAFDAKAPSFYGKADRARGYIIAADRAGLRREFPLMSLSIAIAGGEKRKIDHYAKAADITKEIKAFLKGLPGRRGSMYLKDRRKE